MNLFLHIKAGHKPYIYIYISLFFQHIQTSSSFVLHSSLIVHVTQCGRSLCCCSRGQALRKIDKASRKNKREGGKKAWLSLFTAAQHNVTFQNKTNVFEPQCSDRLIFAVNNTSRLQPRQFKRRTLLEVGHKNVDSKIFSGVLL